ncbi:MAG: ATPase, T2SS/T4P/T4SS family [Gemmatimonadales bacterium]
MVLSTLHTNDAASALTRLVDLGVAPYLVASTVQAVLAQRLVRTLCADCKEVTQPTQECADAFGTGAASLTEVYDARGCSSCRGTGFRGRLRQDGLRQIALGRTTLAEVVRACQE